MHKRAFLMGFPVYLAALSAQFIPVTQAAPIAFHRQQQPQAQNPSSTTHKLKIWTNEDLIATRTPADIYVFEKEAQAAANEAATLRSVASCFAFNQPEGTVLETQKAIQEALQSVDDNEAAVTQAQTELDNAPENLKLRDQMALDQRTAELQRARAQLRALQDHLQQLNEQPAAQNPYASAAASPQ
jgi:Protein of unknown function (DUF2524)